MRYVKDNPKGIPFQCSRIQYGHHVASARQRTHTKEPLSFDLKLVLFVVGIVVILYAVHEWKSIPENRPYAQFTRAK
jgi:hypothetical protein